MNFDQRGEGRHNTLLLKGTYPTSTTVNEPFDNGSLTPISQALPNTNMESTNDLNCNELYLATNSAPGDGDGEEYFSEMVIAQDPNDVDSIVDVSPAASE